MVKIVDHKKLAVGTLSIISLLVVMSLSVVSATSIEISSNDISEIYTFIVVSCGIFVSLIIAHIMNIRAIKKTTRITFD